MKVTKKKKKVSLINANYAKRKNSRKINIKITVNDQ